ncbi:MAG: hypothetical protein A3E78_06055 [Alphaproteobacteria bacterium RIFCSPHIGHO2_12_FULL_63_12]|nr:MAG: hypothetical protein A3E78_06055 [Alphaproteobacteria bacterium RIFCSPHIGHO2_12_FULL_63_12]
MRALPGRCWSSPELLTLASSAIVASIAIFGVIIDNPGEVPRADVLRPLAVGLFAAILIPATLFAIGGALRYVAYAFPIALFAFFKFPVFMNVAGFYGLHGPAMIYLSVAGMLAIVAAATIGFCRVDPSKVSKGIFIVVGAIVVAMSPDAITSMFRSAGRGQSVAGEISSGIPAPVFSRADLPDIIYIVPDRYGSEETLKRQFNQDNGAFYADLERRGFYVARDGRSNYAKTFTSLASALNMADLAPLNARMGADAWERRPLQQLIRDNAVQRILRGAGYEYHHLGSWWGPNAQNPHADANFYGVDTLWSKMSGFEKAILRLTPIAMIATDGASAERVECSRIKNQLDYIAEARARTSKPLYLFAHLTIPHPPVTMDETGKCRKHVYYPSVGTSWPEYQSAYAGYVVYLNKRLLEIFDAAKEADDERGLVFVIQADEGPYPKRLMQNGLMTMHDFTDGEVREKFGIINAIYWDADAYDPPHLEETPINNWRIILSKISGDDISLIDDERSWLMRSDTFVYDVKDVTPILRRSSPRAPEIQAN